MPRLCLGTSSQPNNTPLSAPSSDDQDDCLWFADPARLLRAGTWQPIEAEAKAVDARVRILPIREEPLQERFRELDVPLLLEWPDGRRATLWFVFEEETDPGRFSIHRLAQYCLDLAELFATERVVPVVIFLHSGRFPERLTLGGEVHRCLDIRNLACVLFRTPASAYFQSRNLVARLNLPIHGLRAIAAGRRLRPRRARAAGA